MERRDWVVIELVDNSVQAELIRGLLEQQGILAVMVRDGKAQGQPFRYPVDGDFKVMVKRQDQRRAKELLAEYYRTESEGDE